MKIFQRPFFLFHGFTKSSCQLIAKECTRSAGEMPLEGLSRNSMVRIADRPGMALSLTVDVKHQIKSNQTNNYLSYSAP